MKNQWSVNIKKISEQIGASMDETARAITLELGNSLIENTRVKTGRARGNWQTTLNEPAQGVIDRKSKSGKAPMAELKRKIKPMSLVYISNNLPYIRPLEELDAMLGLTIARIGRIVRRKGQ